MTDPALQQYYNELKSFFDSGELRSLPNNDRCHNATILCFMLTTSTEVNMYCGEMSIFRDNFYTHITNDNPTNPNIGATLKNDMIVALNAFINVPDVRLNIIVENYNDNLFSDVISTTVFSTGIKEKKINIRKLNKDIAVTKGLTHCVYTDTKSVRIEENEKKHSGMFLANMSDTLLNKLKSNYDYLIRSSQPVDVLI